jgi:cell division protein FtsB
MPKKIKAKTEIKSLKAKVVELEKEIEEMNKDSRELFGGRDSNYIVVERDKYIKLINKQ